MFSVCGKNVQTVWVSGFTSCWYSSTNILNKTLFQNQTYGNLFVSRNPIQNNTHVFTQLIKYVFNLLQSGLSTLSTQPIITTKKELKEI